MFPMECATLYCVHQVSSVVQRVACKDLRRILMAVSQDCLVVEVGMLLDLLAKSSVAVASALAEWRWSDSLPETV